MKKLMGFFVLIFLFSCGDYIEKPKNLVSKNDMAEILADMAINDQATFMFQNKNLEAGTRYILKQYNVKSGDFIESFRYYVTKKQMNSIAEDAQKILLEKDPKADKYIKDKLKNSGNVPPFAR